MRRLQTVQFLPAWAKTASSRPALLEMSGPRLAMLGNEAVQST